MNTFSDSEMRLRGQKRVHEGEEMASNHHHHEEKEKAGNFNRFVMRPMKADGTIRNSSLDVPSKTVKSYHELLVQNELSKKRVMMKWQKMQELATSIKEEHLDRSSQYSYQESISERPKSASTSAASQHDGSHFDGSGGIHLSPSVLKFQDVKGFEDFKISVDGLILDSELATDVKVKYYELCCSQQMFLHDHLITGLGSRLVTGVILETSSIADAIKSASLTRSLYNLECWDRTLKAFEALGMNVGFLRTRVDKLVKISRQYQTANKSKDETFAQVEGKKKALGERVSTMEALQKSISTLQESINFLEAELDGVQGENEELGLEFKETAAASW